VQDLESLGIWFHMIYDSNIKGLLTCWDAVIHFAQNAAIDPSSINHEVLLKIPLPLSIRSPLVSPAMLRICTSNPAILPGMVSTVAKEVENILLTAMQTDFSIAIGPEADLPRAAAGCEDMKNEKNIVCIGSSILRQLIPFLQAAGYSITDLTQPGWIATEDNINSLIKKMSDLNLAPGFAVILDLVGNCTYRYSQFDGTLALPYREGGKYHHAGPIQICSEENYKKILKMLSPVLLSAQQAKKVVIPPLPRYLFSTCCSASSHCTNSADENYAEMLLNGITKLRTITKKECSSMGVKNVWVLDGVGAILGTPVGLSSGTNIEVVPELRPYLAKDGVHLETMGNKNVSAAILDSIKKLSTGNLPDDTGTGVAPGPGSGISGSERGGRREFFWRGFTSPTGDVVGRAKAAANGRHNLNHNDSGGAQHAPRSFYHPYNRSYPKKKRN
jgi:hypothetical protein